MVALLTNILTFIIGKEGKEMMAMLWAQQIILGKKTYGQVPRLLKDKVKEILEDSGKSMKIKVVNQRLYLEPPETAEGTREYLKAEFSFSEEWNDEDGFLPGSR